MAMHEKHPTVTRRDRAIERLLELLTRVVELWVQFWLSTEPGEHANGATDRWGDTLHDIDITAVHDQLTGDVGRYDQLIGAEVLCGTDLTEIDGWRLAGSLLDSLPGA